MIREYAPIALIPSAWAMTFATMIYPGISTYWIEHMHYFMIFFLVGFTALSWRKMSENPVLDIWRKVIAAGVLFTGFGALSFTYTDYSIILGGLSIGYWFVVPAVALDYSSNHMEKYSDLYRKVAVGSAVAFPIFVLGAYEKTQFLQAVGLVGIATEQTISIVMASKLDNGE